jgi:hypothetical protein
VWPVRLQYLLLMQHGMDVDVHVYKQLAFGASISRQE